MKILMRYQSSTYDVYVRKPLLMTYDDSLSDEEALSLLEEYDDRDQEIARRLMEVNGEIRKLGLIFPRNQEDKGVFDELLEQKDPSLAKRLWSIEDERRNLRTEGVPGLRPLHVDLEIIDSR